MAQDTSKSTASAAAAAPPPWHASFPPPSNGQVHSISREDLLLKLQRGGENAVPGRDFLVVDLRRDDFVGGTIRSSLNLPAQTLYPSLPTLLTLCEQARIAMVIWYCGSSGGRGTRAAAWFQDVCAERGSSSVQSVILAGGIKGWVAGGEAYVEMMEGYVAEAWQGR